MMKAMLLSALLGVALTWGGERTAAASEASPNVVKTVVKEGEGGKVMIVTAEVAADGQTESAEGGPVQCEVKVIASDDGEDVHVVRQLGSSGATWVADPADRQQVNLLTIGEEVDQNAGWLGVQLGSTSTHTVSGDGTEVKSDGVVILNVAKGSPAAEAGFQRDDVIIEVDDVAIGDDLGELVELVRSASPGERMKFTVMRDGERRALAATLGRRADMKDVEWEYEGGGAYELHDQLRSRAKVLRQGEDGTWRFEILDGGVKVELPEDIGKLLPGNHSRTMTIFQGDDDAKRITIQVIQDGAGLTIETTDDGGIRVTRTEADSGEKTERVYADEDELAANDPEAFEIYDGAEQHHVIDLHWAPFGDARFNIEIDGGEQMVWLEKLEDHIAEQSDALAEAMDRLKELNIEIGDLDDDAAGVTEALKPGNTFFRFLHGTARRTIRENPDGTIDVIVRKGEDELVTRYADEADLASRSPDAYEKYLELRSEDE